MARVVRAPCRIVLDATAKAFVVCALASPASADLLGDEIRACLKSPGGCQSSFTAGLWPSATATIDERVEYSLTREIETISADFQSDVGTDALIIARDATAGGEFEALEWDFRDLDGIEDVMLFQTTSLFVVSDISFTANSIRITTDGFSTGAEGFHAASFLIVAVPEPDATLQAAIAVATLGLLSLPARRRRKGVAG